MSKTLPVIAAALLTLGGARATGQAQVEPMSLMTTPVLLANGARTISQGTGFLYATTRGNVPDQVFLVTNYHVVTGNEPQSQAPAKGDRLQFYFHASREEPTNYFPVNIPLYTKTGDPIWIQSSQFPEADVVLVPIVPALYDNRGQLFVFSEEHTQIDMNVRPSTQATLLGYPYGFFDTKNFLPVWKTGHLASEPGFDFQGEPVFLVDVSAFPGMSGAPVVAVSNGIYENQAGTLMSGVQRRLLGVFSAMRMVKARPSTEAGGGVSMDASTPNPGDSLQLGYAWKISLVNDIARGFNKADWEERIWKNRK